MRNPNVFVTLHAIFQTLMVMKNFRLKPCLFPPLGQRTLARLQEPVLINITFSIVLVTWLLCSCGSKGTNDSQGKITAEMAFEGSTYLITWMK